MDASLAGSVDQRSSSSGRAISESSEAELSETSLRLSRALSQASLIPTSRLAQPSLSLSTPQLLSRLQAVQVSDRVKAPKGLFERVHEVFFNEPLRLQAQTAQQQVLSVSLQSLLDPLSKQFFVKGSGVEWLLAPKTKNLKTNKPLNDYDLAIQVKSFNKPLVQEQFARRLRDQAKQHKRWLNTLSDSEVLTTFFLNPVEGDGWLKLRTAVESGRTPFDLLIYQQLPAEFDAIQASATIKVDTQARVATVDQPLNTQALAWLQRHKLLWLNEQMTGALRRVSRWLAKQPQLRLIQPAPVLAQLYQSASKLEQAHFIVNQFSRQQAFRPLLAPLLNALQVASDLAPVLAHNMKFKTSDLATLQEQLGICVRIFSGGAQALRDFLQTEPEVLAALTPLVEGFVPRPERAELIGLWHSQDVLQHSQLAVLLESVSQHVLADEPHLLELELARASAAGEQDVYAQLQHLAELYQYAQVHQLQTGDLAMVAQQLLLEQLALYSPAVPNRNQQPQTQPKLMQKLSSQPSPQLAQTQHWPAALASALNHAFCVYGGIACGGAALKADSSKTIKVLRERVGQAQCEDLPALAIHWPILGYWVAKPRLQAQVELVSQSFKLGLEDVAGLSRLEQGMAELSTLGPLIQNALATGHLQGSLEGALLEGALNSALDRTKEGSLHVSQPTTQAWIRPDPSRKLVCVFGPETLYVGEIKRIGTQKRIVFHGNGVMLQKAKHLTFIGRFHNGELIDQQLIGCGRRYFGSLKVSQGKFQGPATFVYRTREPNLISMVRIASAVLNVQDQDNHLKTLNPLACSISGDLQHTFDQAFEDPLTAMGSNAQIMIDDRGYIEQVLTYKASRDYVEAVVCQQHVMEPAQLLINWQADGLPAVKIQNYCHRAGHTLALNLDRSNAAPPLAPGQQHRPKAWLSVPDSNNPLVEQPLPTGKTLVDGHYSRQFGLLNGKATIQYSNGEKYIGEVCDHVAHGGGRLLRVGQSFGIVCKMAKGLFSDQRLLEYIRVQKQQGSLSRSPVNSSVSITPFEPRPASKACTQLLRYFSLLGTNQNHFVGLRRHTNTIMGHLVLFQPEQSKEIVSQVLFVGKTVQQFWSKVLQHEQHPAWQDVLALPSKTAGASYHGGTFHDSDGFELIVSPNGKALCADNSATWHEQNFAFGFLLNPKLVTLSSQHSNDLVLGFADKPFHQIIIKVNSVTSMIHSPASVKKVQQHKARKSEQIAAACKEVFGIGTHTDSISHYCGELFGSDAHGQGQRRYIDGATEIGRFHKNEFHQGIFEVPNVLRAEGVWQPCAPPIDLRCTILVPALRDRSIQVPLAEVPAVLAHYNIELSKPHRKRLYGS